jgi:glycosyltransferase involved in cell wall biosynthesis
MRAWPRRRSPSHTAAARRPSSLWIIYFSSVRWTGLRQRQHELASQLSRSFSVLFVEPPTRAGRRDVLPQEVAPGIWRLQPRGPFPLARVVPLLNHHARVRISRSLARWVAEQGSSAVVWVDEHLAARCAGRSGEAAVVFDVVDKDWTFTRKWNRWHLRREMRNACARADLIVCSSKTLASELRRDGREPVVVPNACDPSHFRPEGPGAPELDSLPRPLLGFIGNASARALDLDLLQDVALARPRWSFVFVGPYEEAVRARLARCGNSRFLGPTAYERLPFFVRSFDVCLIPYRVGELIDYVLPKKLYEYLATGRPVVATPLAELSPLGSQVRLAASAEEFAAAVEASLDEAGSQDWRRVRRRRAIALENTWDARGRTVRRLVAELARSA